MQANIWW